MSSKYSALPDIDTQPDVYETPDVVDDGDHTRTAHELDERYEEEEGNGAKKSPSRSKPTVPFKSYHHSSLSSHNHDASEYEIFPHPSKEETPKQKLRRLTFEIQDLLEQVSKNSVQPAEHDSKGELSHKELLGEISGLQRELRRIGRVAEGQAAAREAEKRHQEQAAKEGRDEGDGKEPSEAVPSSALVDLDSRVATLERLMGSTSGQFGELPPLANSNLVATVDKLEHQLTLLTQPRHLEGMSRRVKLLTNDLERLSDLLEKDVPPPGQYTKETEERILKIFGLLEHIDPLMPLTPALLARLQSLQHLHIETATFAESVPILAEEQQKLEGELRRVDEACTRVQRGLERFGAVRKEVLGLEGKLSQLMERVELLIG
ncbi:uncharacterized protein VTP21DRAFT_10991 [Calcarisporiella thermophila]|uniref:uncharacterized protein n=1 Tax=Calcarisporiella thermophila TaxID=911321 RepID=UPI00374334DA